MAAGTSTHLSQESMHSTSHKLAGRTATVAACQAKSSDNET